MVKIEREKAGNIIKTFVSDQLSREDYFKILPALQHTVNEWEQVRWYFEMRDFSGWETEAALEKLIFDIDLSNKMSRIAMVGPKKWEGWLTRAMSLFPQAKVRYFELAEKEEAILWVKS